MSVVVALLNCRDRFEPEVSVEELVEQLLVAPVFDQRHPQHAPQGLAIGQRAVGGRGVHGVQRLGHRHADPAQAQEPHEPVQALFHNFPLASGALLGAAFPRRSSLVPHSSVQAAPRPFWLAGS
jgi:hypothetical protein